MRGYRVETRQYRDGIWDGGEMIPAGSALEAAAIMAEHLRDQAVQMADFDPAELNAWLDAVQIRVSSPDGYCWEGVVFNYADCANVL